MEEVYDLGSKADDALAVQEILEYIVMQYLRDLGDNDLYSQKHSFEQEHDNILE